MVHAYVRRRMRALGVPRHKLGADDPRAGKPWRAFDPDETTGGSISTGLVVDSGVFNPDLLRGRPGGAEWGRASLRDRIDAVVAHEWAEDHSLDHEEAVRGAAETELPVGPGARTILRAMAGQADPGEHPGTGRNPILPG